MAKIDPQQWDPPEYLAISEREFLKDRAQTLHHIQQAAYLSMSQVLVQVQDKFKNDPLVDGWFWRWIEEATPLNKALADRLLAIGKAVKEEPAIAELTRQYTHSSAAIVSRLPPKVRKRVVSELLEHNEILTSVQLRALTTAPEVELEAAEQLVQQLQTTIAKAQIRVATSASSVDRGNAKKSIDAGQRRLQLALEKLSEARAKVAELESNNDSQSKVEALLRAQLKQQQLKLEEATLDPEAKRKRALAKTLVDAANGLDLLLASLDKYSVDRADIGSEAASALERKMLLVQQKLNQLSVEADHGQ